MLMFVPFLPDIVLPYQIIKSHLYFEKKGSFYSKQPPKILYKYHLD